MIVGYRSSDVCTFIEDGDLTNFPNRVHGTMYPIILIPEAEPKPSYCGYSTLISEIKANKDRLMAQRTTLDYVSDDWISIGSQPKLAQEISELAIADERQFMVPVPLNSREHEHLLEWLEYLRGQDSQLGRQLSHIVTSLSGGGWLG